MDLQLTGRCAVVTGGTKGIGAGIATVLAEEGCDVVVNYRSHREDAEAFAAELAKKTGRKIVPICADISTEGECARLFKEAAEALGDINILINNANSGFASKEIKDMTAEDWHKASVGMFEHMMFMSREFTNWCIDHNHGGNIVLLGSRSAIESNSTGNLPYVGYKGAIFALTRGMARELIRYGISVNSILPGYVRTERLHNGKDERTERIRPFLRLPDFATTREMGNVAAMLCSPLFKQILGVSVDASGGTLL